LTTDDGGQHWARQTLANAGNISGVTFSDPRHVWIVSGTGSIQTSEDAGATWTPDTSPTHAGLLSVDFADADHGWIVGTRGIILARNSQYQPPTVSGFTPTSGPVGTSVTVNGTGFSEALSVEFGHVLAEFTVESDIQIIAVVPDDAVTGPISVSNPGGTAVSANAFGVSPSITGFTPASGLVGITVTITGSGLAGVSGVAFNGTAASSFTVVGTDTITAVVPAGASTGRITVVSPSGGATSAADFTVGQQVQAPANGCVTAPPSIPKRGIVRLTKAGCATNAGQPVRVAVSGRALPRGDQRYYRVIRRSNGAVFLRTYGYRLALRITWSAPAIGSYLPYRAVRAYRTVGR
ncbi:MAG: IPT/TIG domain-containing protein, partial [Actinomycetes bacterium]